MSLFPLPAGKPERFPGWLLASAMDLAAFTICGLLAFQLRFDGSVPAAYKQAMRQAIYIWASKVGCVPHWRGEPWLLAIHVSR